MPATTDVAPAPAPPAAAPDTRLVIPTQGPSTGLRTVVHRSRSRRRRARHAGREGHARKRDHVVGRAAPAHADREPSWTEGVPDARGRSHDVARRSFGVCQQPSRRRVPEHPRQLRGAAGHQGRRGLLPDRRARRCRGPQESRRERHDPARARRRQSRHRSDPVGDGAGALPRAVGDARRLHRTGARGRASR